MISKTIKVLDTYADFDHLPDAEGEYTSATLLKENLTSSFTICSSFMIEAWFEYRDIYLFILNGKDGYKWGSVYAFADLYGQRFDVTFGTVSFTSYLSRVLFPGEWQHVCVSFNGNSSEVILVLNGQVKSYSSWSGAVVEKDENIPSSLNITLGVLVGKYGINFEYPALYTNLNVFSSVLNPYTEMKKITSEECGAPGDLLSWEDAEWSLHSKARFKAVDSQDVCKKTTPAKWKMQLFPAEFQWHHDCMSHCKKLGEGRAPPVTTLEEWEILQKELEAITSDISDLPFFWLSATDSPIEGLWRDHYTKDIIGNYTRPWFPGHDGGNIIGENCLRYHTQRPGEYAWAEGICNSANMGCFCQYDRQPLLKLRGLCGSWFENVHAIDRYFTPTQMYSAPNDMFLIGDKTSRMTYNQQTKQWKITSARSNISAVTKIAKTSYAMGKYEWFIENDECNDGLPYTTWLKLTGCLSDYDENWVKHHRFTCNDGQCIMLEERCNQIKNCEDGSDEKDCQLLILKDGYNKNVPPIIVTTDFNLIPTPVSISIVLMKIVAMEETQHSIDFQFEIILKWKDNRAIYQNLKKDKNLNALVQDDIYSLWLPYVIYENTDMKEAVQLEEGVTKTTMVVNRDQEKGSDSDFSMDQVDEVAQFNGDANTLIMRQTYTKRFQCQYELHYYPFDKQVAFMSCHA